MTTRPNQVRCGKADRTRAPLWPAGPRLTPAILSIDPAIAKFVEPMAALVTAKLPEGEQWVYELKFDGYRALALKRGDVFTMARLNERPYYASIMTENSC